MSSGKFRFRLPRRRCAVQVCFERGIISKADMQRNRAPVRGSDSLLEPSLACRFTCRTKVCISPFLYIPLEYKKTRPFRGKWTPLFSSLLKEYHIMGFDEESLLLSFWKISTADQGEKYHARSRTVCDKRSYPKPLGSNKDFFELHHFQSPPIMCFPTQ